MFISFSVRSARNILNVLSLSLALLTLAGCPNFEGKEAVKETPTAKGEHTITVSWDENREAGVNSVDGGYRVYYASAPGVAVTGNTSFVQVPYVSGPKAPTSATISKLPAGDLYIKVVAYAKYNPHNVIGGAKSLESGEFKITITE